MIVLHKLPATISVDGGDTKAVAFNSTNASTPIPVVLSDLSEDPAGRLVLMQALDGDCWVNFGNDATVVCVEPNPVGAGTAPYQEGAGMATLIRYGVPVLFRIPVSATHMALLNLNGVNADYRVMMTIVDPDG